MLTAAINTIDIPLQESPNQEGIELTTSSLDISITDTDLVANAIAIESEIDLYWNKFNIKTRREVNYKYWRGLQIDESKLREDQEKGVDNVIFRNLETMIPIVSARTPELVVTATYKNDSTRKFAKDIERALPVEWEDLQKVQPLIGRGVRNHQINFIGIYKVGYDSETQEFWTTEIDASNLKISKDGSVVIEYIKDQKVRDVLAKFPEKESEIKRHLGASPTLPIPKTMLDSPCEYTEIWDQNIGVLMWKLSDIILAKSKNPHFDWDGKEITLQDGSKKIVKFNHFKKPKHPYLFLTYFNRGIHIMDDTTLIEQGIGPQDWVNKRKRQIGANADSTNGHWVSSGDFISSEEFDKITGGIDEKIWLEKGKPLDGLAKITGPALPDYIYQDLLDSRSVMDNLMGTHATTRGEGSGNSTATQDIMQKDQDYGRVDGYIRDGIELLASRWYEYMYHLYLVYKTEESAIPIPESDDLETDNVLFSQDKVPLVYKNNGDLIPVPLLFKVKNGSTLPKDPVSEYAKAKEQKDVLAPIDYFKKVGEANPRQLARNFLIWQTDPFYFFKDDQEMQALFQQNMHKEQAAAMATAGNPPMAGAPKGGSAIIANEPSAEGVSRAMNAIIKEQGIDPKLVTGGAQ